MYGFPIQENGASKCNAVTGLYYEYKLSIVKALLCINKHFLKSLCKHVFSSKYTLKSDIYNPPVLSHDYSDQLKD